MRLLDLYCRLGGASMGYRRAGFRVVGVDIDPYCIGRYPFRFVEDDALAYLRRHGHRYDLIAASPPCQAHSSLRSVARKTYETADLLEKTIAACKALGKPYIIENVDGPDNEGDLMLCGTMFGLGAHCGDGTYRQLWRHRQFWTNLPLTAPGPCRHSGSPVGVYGGGGGQQNRGYMGTKAERAEALGIDWMSRRALAQAIPPAYTEHLGRQAAEHLRGAAA